MGGCGPALGQTGLIGILLVGCGRIDFAPLAPTGAAACRPLTITSPTDALVGDYTVSAVFDHAALVAEGKASASGVDLAVTYRDQVIDRVLDNGSAWNTSTTKIWFRLQSPIAAGATSTDYALCYPRPALSDPRQVYVLWDDFSASTLDTSTWKIVYESNVAVVAGKVAVTGTTTNANQNAMFGIESTLTFDSDVLVQGTFAIVAQSALAQQNWKGLISLETNFIAPLLINSDASADKRVQYYTGIWHDVGDSGLDAITFGDQVLTQTLTQGVATHSENGVLKATRSGVPLATNYVGLEYGPDVANETFSVTFDDAMVRRYIASDAEITVSVGTEQPQP
jgi:hypothetical protein